MKRVSNFFLQSVKYKSMWLYVCFCSKVSNKYTKQGIQKSQKVLTLSRENWIRYTLLDFNPLYLTINLSFKTECSRGFGELSNENVLPSRLVLVKENFYKKPAKKIFSLHGGKIEFEFCSIFNFPTMQTKVFFGGFLRKIRH